MPRIPRDRGVATTEYVAVVAFVAVIAGTLTFTDIPARVADACMTAICRIVGGDDCAAPDVPPGGGPSEAEPAPEPADRDDGPQEPARPPISKPTCQDGSDLPQSGGFELHAHNDYENSDPLDDALDHGATSVEADVYLDGDDLVLRHSTNVVDQPQGTLEDEYIDALRGRAAENGGEIHPGRSEPFTLVIEIKDEGAKAAEAYDRALEQLEDLPDGVQVVFSGGYPPERSYEDWANADYSEIGRQPPNVSFDVGPEDGCRFPSELDPASTEYQPDFAQHFATFNADWGECEHLSQQELNDLVRKAHDAGLKVRFWGGPDDAERMPGMPSRFRPCPGGLPGHQGCEDDAENTRNYWDRLMEAGVDYLNTNHLGKGQRWLESCGDEY